MKLHKLPFTFYFRGHTDHFGFLSSQQPGDAGLFTCVATNAAGSARQDMRLSINMRPAFKELPGDVTLNKGQRLALSCHAQGTPSPVISWTVNNSPYSGIPFLKNISNLRSQEEEVASNPV